MNFLRNVKFWFFLSLMGTTGLCVYLFSGSFKELGNCFQPLSFPIIFLVSAIFLSNLCVAAFRLQIIYKKMGLFIPYIKIFRAFLTGQISSLLFFPSLTSFYGQTLVLSKSNKKIGHNVTAYLIDRFISLAVGFSLALAGLFILKRELFQKILSENNQLLPLFISLATAFFFVIKKFFSLQQIWSMFLENFFYILLLSFLSLVSWIAMGSIFMILYKIFDPQTSTILVMAASFIISFAASLPITPNGWGIREVTAIKAFGFLGLQVHKGLFIGFTVGSLATVLIIVTFYLVCMPNFIKKMIFHENTK
ncbi:MAG: lysylphosphatidylglycerol synthase domain-containing protein [Alphaproteobacteria bacterium]